MCENNSKSDHRSAANRRNHITRLVIRNDSRNLKWIACQTVLIGYNSQITQQMKLSVLYDFFRKYLPTEKLRKTCINVIPLKRFSTLIGHFDFQLESSMVLRTMQLLELKVKFDNIKNDF